MKYSAAAVAAFVAGASASYAQSNETAPVYTTEVLTAYTTYCPEPTTISYGTNTYTITEATTLTITDCPCTVSKPVASTSAVPSYPVSVPGVPAPSGSAPVPSAPGAPAPYPTGNATVPAIPSGTAPGVPTTEVPTETQPSATGSESSTPSAPVSTGAAARSFAPAGLAGLVGLAAYLL